MWHTGDKDVRLGDTVREGGERDALVRDAVGALGHSAAQHFPRLHDLHGEGGSLPHHTHLGTFRKYTVRQCGK